MKVEATAQELLILWAAGGRPRYSVSLFERYGSPEKLSAYLNALPISDVGESGVDNRGELNATMTLAGLGYFKKPFGEYLAEHATGLPRGQGTYTVGPFAGSFERFLRATQDPITGYWGAVYRSDGRLYRSTDLSMTSHIVGYRKGQVDFRPAIVKTTLRIATNTSEFK